MIICQKKRLNESQISLSMSNITTNDDEIVLYANYDGSPIGKGDLVITTWTMIRPA